MGLSSSKVTITAGKTKKVTLKNAPEGAVATGSTGTFSIAKVKCGTITVVKRKLFLFPTPSKIRKDIKSQS